MSKLALNLMVLGKTGAGKSSLINYLVGRKVVETGAGEPVTQKGDFTHIQVPTDEKLDYNIYDSWGLEANKAEEWKKLIKNKLEHVGNSDNSMIISPMIINPIGLISDVFLDIYIKNITMKMHESYIHAVLYCISCNFQRLEPFELEIIEEILKLNFKVLVVFTQADSSNAQKSQEAFEEMLNAKLGKYSGNFSIISSCASPVKKLGQTQAPEPYGKEEIEKSIFADIWHNILHRNLAIWENNINNLLDKQEKIHDKMIENLSVDDSFWDNFKPRSLLANEVVEKIRSDFDITMPYIEKSIEDIIKYTTQYYMALNENYFGKISNNSEFKVTFGTQYGDEDFFNTAAAMAIMHIIPIINIFFKIFEKDMIRDEIRAEYRKVIAKLKEQIEQNRTEIYEKFSNKFLPKS